MKTRSEVLFEGEHLSFLRADGWEYVEHRKAKEAVMIVAVTAEGLLVLADEFRPAVGARVISLPAGLVGDTGPEDPRTAATRELREETGHEAAGLEVLGRGPGSAGASSEIVTFYLARGARRVGEQAPEDRSLIRVHLVALPDLRSWARGEEAKGTLIDPKIWAGLHLAEAAGITAASPPR